MLVVDKPFRVVFRVHLARVTSLEVYNRISFPNPPLPHFVFSLGRCCEYINLEREPSCKWNGGALLLKTYAMFSWMYFKLEFQVESTIHLPCQQRLHNVTLCNIYMCIGSRCIRSRSLGRSHNLIHGDKKEESLRICFVRFRFVNYLTLIACFTTFKNWVQNKVLIFFFFFLFLSNTTCLRYYFIVTYLIRPIRCLV